MTSGRPTEAEQRHYVAVSRAMKELGEAIDAAFADECEVECRVDASRITISESGVKHVRLEGPRFVRRWP